MRLERIASEGKDVHPEYQITLVLRRKEMENYIVGFTTKVEELTCFEKIMLWQKNLWPERGLLGCRELVSDCVVLVLTQGELSKTSLVIFVSYWFPYEISL